MEETIEATGSEQALRLARRGFKLFPCVPETKTPLVKWGKAATSNVQQVNTWLHKFPRCNWAVKCGKASRLFVVDIDGPKGLQSFVDLCVEAGVWWGSLAESTLGVKTYRGSHLYFAWPDTVIRNSQRKLSLDLDVRGEGGYVVVPPSIHPSGEPYQWLGNDDSKEIAAAPEWLVEKILAVQQRQKGQKPPRKARLRAGAHGLPYVAERRRTAAR